MGVEW